MTWQGATRDRRGLIRQGPTQDGSRLIWARQMAVIRLTSQVRDQFKNELDSSMVLYFARRSHHNCSRLYAASTVQLAIEDYLVDVDPTIFEVQCMASCCCLKIGFGTVSVRQIQAPLNQHGRILAAEIWDESLRYRGLSNEPPLAYNSEIN